MDKLLNFPADHPPRVIFDTELIATEIIQHGNISAESKFNAIVKERKLVRWEAMILREKVLSRYLQLKIQKCS